MAMDHGELKQTCFMYCNSRQQSHKWLVYHPGGGICLLGYSLEKEQVRIHDGLTGAYALFAAIEDTFLLLNLLNDWMNDLHH